jgi:hypothetical protein
MGDWIEREVVVTREIDSYNGAESKKKEGEYVEREDSRWRQARASESRQE